MKNYNIKDPKTLILRDYLAIDRTKLAMKRTFLAFVRTALGLFSAGVACIKFIYDMPVIFKLGYIMIYVSPVILLIGLIDFLAQRERLKTIQYNHLINK